MKGLIIHLQEEELQNAWLFAWYDGKVKLRKNDAREMQILLKEYLIRKMNNPWITEGIE